MYTIRKIRYYPNRKGESPFEIWFKFLKDHRAKSIIIARIKRLALGNPGKYSYVGKGVWELKIYFGPGYRVYYGEDGNDIVVILCGGDKSTQTADIKESHLYWEEYRRGK